MKLKDVGFFQQHIEKLLLGVALLILVAVAANYLLRDPYQVTIGGRDRGIGEVEEAVRAEAARLQESLDSKEVPFEDRQIPQYTQNFRERWEEPLVNFARLPAPLEYPGLAQAHLQPPEGMDKPYYLPRPPVATDLMARAGYGLLGEAPDPRVQSQLVELVGARQPGDFRYVSVAATFDMDEWTRRLRSTPNTGDVRRLPDAWWRNRLGVGSVYLQRQTRDPLTGEWGDTTVVPPLPTSEAALSPEQRMEYLINNQSQVARPEFVPLAANSRWLPPDSEGWLEPGDYQKFQELTEDLENLQRRIDSLERIVDRRSASRPGEEAATAPERAIDPEMNEMAEMFGAGVGGRRSPAPSPTARNRNEAQTPEQQLEVLRQQRDELQAQRDAMIGREQASQAAAATPGGPDPDAMMAEYAAMGAGVNRAPAGRGAPAGFGEWPAGAPAGVNQPAQQQPDGEVKVWAHDVTVEPGKTYRYRVLVDVLNPLFRQTRPPQAQRAEHYDRLTLAPAEEELSNSSWSEPVTIDAETYFFMVSASPQQRVAEVEVWRLYQGTWRSQQFEVQPGDPVGGQATLKGPRGNEQTVPMAVDAVMVDLMQTSGGSTGGGLHMLYLDRQTNQMRDRSLEEDLNHPLRMKLQTEAMIQDELARGPGT